ncbi:MAG: hypothetical protein R3C13_10475 [Hyphomonas sp.]|uniref:acetoin utilization protein AcuC n=1 Tax=Hyphomonas sp. TaxID=87 RepID=UPI003527BAEB
MAIFVTHSVFREPGWSRLHPLSGNRQAAVIDICEMLGWLDEDHVRQCEPATRETLRAFHDADYIDAMMKASMSGQVSSEIRTRYKIGTMENPIFERVFERASASVGGSILAAREALIHGCAYHPAGGTHHGRRDTASGFCYFNDPVFAVQTLIDAGATPVLYVDIDAHHGDGVELAFADHPDVVMISTHEEGRWPHSGMNDGSGPRNAHNFPLPRGINDSEFLRLIDGPVAQIAARTKPAAVVIVAGADCLDGDPLSSMALSNIAFWDAIDRVRGFAPVQVVLGGGGYNPWTTVRAWAGLWGRLSGQPLPDALPEAAQERLRIMSCDLIDEDEMQDEWTTTLCDTSNRGPIRDEVKRLSETFLAA